MTLSFPWPSENNEENNPFLEGIKSLLLKSFVMSLKKNNDRLQLKLEFMLEAAERYEYSSKTGFKTLESRNRQLRSARQSNFVKRESIRSELGISEKFESLRRVEEAMIDTWDAENFPPHKTASLLGKPVARIIDNSEEKLRGFGTGFLISDHLFLTNFHVFPDLDYAMDCVANFGYEYNSAGTLFNGVTFNLEPGRFFMNNKALDFAIVAISNKSVDGKTSLAELGCLPLIDTPGKIIEGEDINIIQYPLGNHKQYACKQNQVLKIFEEEGFVQYVTDTAKASSGSPCFNKFWELAALHHCAIPLVENKKVIAKDNKPWDGRDEDDVKWISNEGISISKIIAYLKNNIKSFKIANIDLLVRLLSTVRDPLLNPSMETAVDASDSVVKMKAAANTNISDSRQENMNAMSPINLNFYGPTTVNIGLAGAPSAKQISVESTEPPGRQQITEEAQPPIRFDEDYETRDEKGYNPGFLEPYTLTIPQVQDERFGDMYTEDGEVVEFKYYNYSLVMNKKRRMCMWTAVNVNYDKVVKPKKARKEFGRDVWRPDPRLDERYQVLREELYDPAKNFDLGHIVRRDDACWGYSEEEIEFANSDTFHYSNCTPQHEAFNRANPPKDEGYEGIHGVWGALEEHITRELKNVDNKATIFAGPHLAKNDPVQDFGLGSIKYPLRFWKIICVRDGNGQLFSYGFWLDQSDVINDYGLGLERLDFKKFKKQQMPIREITERTKIDFDEQIYKTDVLVNNHHFEAGDPGISYDDVKDIQIFPKR